jgi:glycosyltransferase involved in cell wall biosynthesis
MQPTSLETSVQTTTENRAPDAPRVSLSVVIPVSERADRLAELHRQLSAAVADAAEAYEIIYVVDGPRSDVLDELRKLQGRDGSVQLILLNRWFGEATALAVGLDRARGETILTVPSYPQAESSEFARLIEAFGQGDEDLLVARRYPRVDSRFNRLQSAVFHWIVSFLTGTRYHDVSCGLRIMNGSVAHGVDLYGDLHRFFPLLAFQKGFRVAELPVRQSRDDAGRRVHGPGVYLRRLLDILTLFFIFKFTKKPLRFFGLVGSGVFSVGGAILLYLGAFRLFQFGPIANRPLLILGTLLIVLGLQLFSIGLLGEIVIFTHAKSVKDYRVREIREQPGDRDGAD